jgi:hypothetical protein
MTRTGAPLPDWQLERYRLGELPPDEAEALREALATDAVVRERLAWLEESDREILATHPPAEMVEAIRARAAAAAPSSVLRPAWRPPLLAAMAALGLVLVGGSAVLLRGPRGDGGTKETRVKGLTPRLFVYRKGASAAELLASGSVAHENDVVQLAYQAAGRRFGAIVSVDGRGVVTRHLPATGNQPLKLRPGAAVALDQAYRLDDAPGFERFYLVTADAPFPVDAVVAAAAKAPERLDLPPSIEQQTIVLEKETAR